MLGGRKERERERDCDVDWTFCFCIISVSICAETLSFSFIQDIVLTLFLCSQDQMESVQWDSIVVKSE